MISINGLTVAFGGFTLLDSIDFHISDNDKIGLVGKNGSGKSTIMKLICGLQVPSSGSVDKPNGVRIGYLPQIMEHHKGRTVMEETMTAFDHITSMQRELEDINVSLSERTDYESESYLALINRLNDLTDALAIVQNEPVEVLAQKTLLGLGFKDEDFGRRTETFSQGWNMRIELAKVLLSEPDLLLLDEPTNHLDIESIEWLEDFLKAFRGSLLLVSHDRKFLDNVTNRTVEIVLGHIYDYKVPYSQYVELHKERVAQQQAAYANQQRMIEKTEVFINKFRYKPTKSNQVQSRIKQLEKLERLEIDETDNAALTVKFPPAPRSGDIVFKGSDLTVGYPGKVVFTDAEIEVKRGEKVALIGRNGEGKTTLMRVIAGELTPISGTARTGHNVSMGYYAQNQEDALDRNLTVFETLDNIAVGDIRTKLRDILAQFLFRGEDIDKKVSVLSGGERARLGMARFMLQPYNLLALDEPTNHMDIKSKDILKQALKAYDGTLIVVSHDRDFLDGLVDKMYEFRDGKVKEHVGSVAEFLEKRKIESLQELERRFGPSLQQSGEQAEVVEGKEKAKQAFQQRRSESKELRRMKHRVEFLEGEIGKIESVMKDIEKVLSNPTASDDIMELTRTYLENKRELDRKTAEWTSLMEQIEESNF
ncbi:MAG: ABC-F family ATP-binding cassette domain-containing protein [Candidatus Cryptobacteroides sp.]|nr:ABC-F family ATP-binding cassette domain-containing protein [Candidatus Cryptobacteroides sp.]